jgi:hypothetical protein
LDPKDVEKRSCCTLCRVVDWARGIVVPRGGTNAKILLDIVIVVL